MRMVATVLLLASLAGAQEIKHAPTIEQCRADQRVWLAEFERENARGRTLRTLLLWGNEMSDCRHVDPQKVDSYGVVQGYVTLAEADRYSRFLERYGLMQQFVVEDEAGKR